MKKFYCQKMIFMVNSYTVGVFDKQCLLTLFFISGALWPEAINPVSGKPWGKYRRCSIFTHKRNTYAAMHIYTNDIRYTSRKYYYVIIRKC